ncbi:MAG: prepilin peptidase [Lachnospiraceae bacterium]|nr:prepilin peptidase [Lachnospiraceae bacterium]
MWVLSFVYGIVIGSFLNVCIYRIPKKENIVVVRSHCMECGYTLKWFDLIPLFSYIFLKGRCRKCGTKLSVQYPLIEALNGVLYVVVFIVKGAKVESLLYCLLFSALLALSVIDFRTYEIPVGFNYFIAALGIINLFLNYTNWADYLIGLGSVSGFLLILYFATKGRAIGGGDIKLMAACGLLLGWKLVIFAFCAGCVIGAIVHVIRMKVSKADKVLAMGPYLSIGVGVAALWGDTLLKWYLSMLGI